MKTRVRLAIAMLLCFLLLTACGSKKPDKVIRYTYMPKGEISTKLPDSYENDIEVYTILIDAKPSIDGEVTLEMAKTNVTQNNEGCWELIESSSYTKDVAALSAFTLERGEYKRALDGSFGQYNYTAGLFYELLRTEDNTAFFRITKKTNEDFEQYNKEG